MSDWAKIISIALKFAVNKEKRSELVGELTDFFIDNSSEKYVGEIEKFINEKKSQIEYTLSKENMLALNIQEDNVDFVIYEIRDLLLKFEITDDVFRKCKYDVKKLSLLMWEKYCEQKDDIECEKDFRSGLFIVADKLLKLLYEGEEFEKKLLIQISNSVDDTNVGIQELSGMINSRFNRLDEVNEKIYNKVNEECIKENVNNKSIIKNRMQEYLDKWNENMFLNNFSKWDGKKGINIKLSDVYIESHLPHFRYGDNNKLFCNISEFLSEYVIDDSNDNKMLLILGQLGIGKSTLITWITANFVEKIDDILVYQFASDLKDIDWQNFSRGELLIDELGLSYNDLNNKVLILDGFDEISIQKDKRIDVLNIIYEKLVYKINIRNFKLIITCRENYINNANKLKCDYLTLQLWDEEQIKSFCNVYSKKTETRIHDYIIENILNNKVVFGIPLILYVTLALEIIVEKESSIIDIYDKIFSLDGGIYDRCIDNKNFADKHRIGEIKEQIHQVSREIAFWMFENNSEKAVISQKEYQAICKEIATDNKGDLEQDFIIGNFFNLKHCDSLGTNELCFVHRSIYEYFVIDYIFDSMYKSIESSEKLAGVFGHFLKRGQFSEVFCDFLKYKIQKSELNNKFALVLDTFNLMLTDGMTYYTNKCYKNVIICEMRIFVNMLEIIHLWDNKNLKINESISNYFNYNDCAGLNLRNIVIQPKIRVDRKIHGICSMPFSGIYLQEANMVGVNLKYIGLPGSNLMLADLTGADLSETDLLGSNLSIANLKDTNLTKAILIDADLSNANLSGAILKEAMLIRAKLANVILEEADLTETIFDEKQIKYLENKYDLNESCVYLKKGEIISYREYKEKTSKNV